MCTVVVQVEQSNGVGCGLVVIGIGPCGVVERVSVHDPLIITAEVGVLTIAAVDRLGGIHCHSGTNGTRIGILGVSVHSLEVEVDVQVVVEETGAQAHRSCGTLEVRGLENTLLTGVTHRHAVRKNLTHRTSYRHTMILRESSAVDLVLPVGIGIAKCSNSIIIAAVALIEVLHKLTILVAIHDVDGLLLHTHRCATVVAHAYLLALTTLLGGDDDNTIRTTATIDSCGRSVLQDIEALDILGVNERQRIGKTFHAIVVHRHTVDDDQRVVAGIQ